MSMALPSLSYALDALEPYITANTLSFHHGKHHQAYVTNLNALISGTSFEQMSLEEIVKTSSGSIFNNAAQVWNHTFYFENLSKKKPLQGAFLKEIEKAFGSFEAFCGEFKKAAVGQFGSGWAWLIHREGKLAIEATSNASIPQHTPLLTCDVWEHAYYLDYQNRRADYIDVFLRELINWEVVENRFEHA